MYMKAIFPPLIQKIHVPITDQSKFVANAKPLRNHGNILKCLGETCNLCTCVVSISIVTS